MHLNIDWFTILVPVSLSYLTYHLVLGDDCAVEFDS